MTNKQKQIAAKLYMCANTECVCFLPLCCHTHHNNLHAMTLSMTTTGAANPRFCALSLLAFAAGKSRDYASHWLKRQLAHAVSGRAFARLLTDDRLRATRGGHRIYMLDQETAHRFVMLLPREWAVPQQLLDKYFHATESQRADVLLEQFMLAPVIPSTPRKPRGEHIFAAFSEGNGVRIESARGSGGVARAVRFLSSSVRHPYKLLSSVRCKHAAPVLAAVAKLFPPAAHARILDVAPAQLMRVFRALKLLKRRAEKKKTISMASGNSCAGLITNELGTTVCGDQGDQPRAKRARGACEPLGCAHVSAGGLVCV